MRTFAATVNYDDQLVDVPRRRPTGRAQNELTGCALAQAGTGPSFCRSALPMNDTASLAGAGLAGLPMLFPNAGVHRSELLRVRGAERRSTPPIWDGTRISMVPNFAWGSRVANAPPNMPFPGYLNINTTNDIVDQPDEGRAAGTRSRPASTTRTATRRSSARAGPGTITFAQRHAATRSTRGFGFANAALGIFSSLQPVLASTSKGSFVYNNVEAYVQDNWKVNSQLTLDYGVRFVHQQPQYDKLGQASNFLPEEWTPAQAPVLYVAGCAATRPCTGANRQAHESA